jgi:hypothetical protein
MLAGRLRSTHAGRSSMLATDRASQDQSMANRCSRCAPMESLAAIMRCHGGGTIYDQGVPAEYWYRIASGLARKCAVTPEGRRLIVDFLLPGDFFGFSARDEHAFAVEAVETVSRSLTRLRHRGAIALLGKRRVMIVDRSIFAKAGGDMGQGQSARPILSIAVPAPTDAHVADASGRRRPGSARRESRRGAGVQAGGRGKSPRRLSEGYRREITAIAVR